MKSWTQQPAQDFKTMPRDYGMLCRTDHAAALSAIEPMWGHEADFNQDQADWFTLVTDLIADYEAQTEKKPKRLSITQRLTGLLEAHGMTAADFGRLLELEPSMGSKILHGTRRLTTTHIRKLARHFALSADYFLEA